MATAYELISEYKRKRRASDEAAERCGRAVKEAAEAGDDLRSAGQALADAIRRLGRPVLELGAYPTRMYDLAPAGGIRVVELAQAHDDIPVDDAPPADDPDDDDPDATGTAAGDDDAPGEGPLDGSPVVPDQAVSLAFGAGDPVEVRWAAGWLPGKVLEAVPAATVLPYLVSFDDFPAGLWFSPGDVRARAEAETLDGAADRILAVAVEVFGGAEAPPVSGGAPDDGWMSDPEAGAPPLGPRPCRDCGSL